MYKHLLVPLDGSVLAETAIPASIILAEVLKAKITLLHIVEKNAPEKIHGEYHIKTYEEASDYLKNIIKNRYPKNLKVNLHVHSGGNINVVNAIALHHKELSSDLLVMTTHGWGGIKEIFFGNNAEKIINLGIMPVLFIPPNFPKIFKKQIIKKMLIPLDGTDKHESGLETAIDLADKFSAEIYLVNVIPTINTLPAQHTSIGMLLPVATREVLKIIENDAELYISIKKKEIEKKGIKVNTEISFGYPEKKINKIAVKKNINLIVIGTHGKAGLNAFWSGSVASKITKKSKTAILYIPVKQNEK